jgi:hypothetical protein
MYIVKETPIIKNKKLYRVGDLFPYSDKDSHLLWNLEKQETVPETLETAKETVSTQTETTNNIESPKIAKSKAKKTNS